MANALAYRLKRLEAFREVAQQAARAPAARARRVRRGDPEPIAEIKQPQWSATLYDLLSAYAVQRQKQALGACAVRAAHGVVARRSARRRSSG